MRKLVGLNQVLLNGLLMSVAVLAQAQGPRWIYLGEANVDGNVDHDNIVVGRDEGSFRAIQLRVEIAAIDFDRVVVHYSNGEPDRIPIRGRIRAGGESRVIDLQGNRRDLRSVEIWYAKENFGSRRPKVRLYGRR
jgi:hypothetical protein